MPPSQATEATHAAATSLRREQTRRLLVTAAHDVFVEHGIRDAPVELICQRAGFSRGAFYSNFATKEELFLALLKEEMRSRVGRVRSAIDDTINPMVPLDQGTVLEKIHQIYQLCAEPLVADQTWYMLLSEFKTRLLHQPELAAEANIELAGMMHETGDMLADASARMGMELTVPPKDAAHAIAALATASLEQASVESLNSVDETSFFTNTLPRLLCAMITPKDTSETGD